jgi:hypothetical protein
MNFWEEGVAEKEDFHLFLGLLKFENNILTILTKRNPWTFAWAP